MALDQHGTLLKMVVMVSQHHFTGRPCWSWLSWFICLSSRLWARALSREIDARWVAVASLLPDLIDKPLRYMLAPGFTQGNTRTVGHSLTVLLVVMVLV